MRKGESKLSLRMGDEEWEKGQIMNGIRRQLRVAHRFSLLKKWRKNLSPVTSKDYQQVSSREWDEKNLRYAASSWNHSEEDVMKEMKSYLILLHWKEPEKVCANWHRINWGRILLEMFTRLTSWIKIQKWLKNSCHFSQRKNKGKKMCPIFCFVRWETFPLNPLMLNVDSLRFKSVRQFCREKIKNNIKHRHYESLSSYKNK